MNICSWFHDFQTKFDNPRKMNDHFSELEKLLLQNAWRFISDIAPDILIPTHLQNEEINED